eukprot:3470296-Pyramimonas_sp.AAC.1
MFPSDRAPRTDRAQTNKPTNEQGRPRRRKRGYILTMDQSDARIRPTHLLECGGGHTRDRRPEHLCHRLVLHSHRHGL